MDGSTWFAVGTVAFCFVASAFFSGSETALTASSRARMHTLEKNGDKRAAVVNRMLMARERLIGGLLIGNNIVNTSAAALTTGILLSVFGDAGILYATIVVSVLVIVFSEILPKTIAINHPDRVALIVARPVSVFVALFGPITMALELIIRVSLKVVGVEVGGVQNVLSATDELRGQVDLLHKEGGVDKAKRDMLDGLLDLEELSVADVMVHRTRMHAIDVDQPPQDIVAEVLRSPYTRLPLWRDTHENIVGVLHAKDLLRALNAVEGKAALLDIERIAQEPWFVLDVTNLRDQLRAFLVRKVHFALVVDEYGDVQGIVTLEDILEEIVGDIRDEHDVQVQGLTVQADGSVLVEGAVPIRDLNRSMDWELPDEEATTIAGLVIHEARVIPDPGQSFTFHGFDFHVLRKIGNRITLIRIQPTSQFEAVGDAATG